MKEIAVTPKEVPLSDMDNFDALVIICKDIEKYLEVFEKIIMPDHPEQGFSKLLMVMSHVFKNFLNVQLSRKHRLEKIFEKQHRLILSLC